MNILNSFQKMNNILKLIISIGLPLLAGFIGSLFTRPAIPTWYAGLEKSSLNPPSWVFAPVWTTLFLLMGISAYLIWRKGLERKDVQVALIIFLGQLILNVGWSVLFFGLKSPAFAFGEILVLLYAIGLMIFAFWKISKPAAWILVPYFLWVGFATYLTYSVWQLNSNQVPLPAKSLQETFQSLDTLPTKYISGFDWPPKLQIVNEPFTCTEAGSETDRTGQTLFRKIDGRDYCITKRSEGAAGSIYSQYAYAFPKNNQTMIFTFSTRSVQCGNYDELNKIACEVERTSFNLDKIVEDMTKTLQ